MAGYFKTLRVAVVLLMSIVTMKMWACEVVDSVPAAEVSEFSAEQTIEQAASLPDMKVIVGNDTVSMILKDRNLGRYDRGLYNFLFIPKGQWSFGLSASYGEFDSENVQILSLMKDLTFKGKLYSVKPEVNYFIRNNQSLGFRFNYTRGEADLSSAAIDFDEDINFSLKDVSYYSQSYGVSCFYRNYIGLSLMKRFAIYNEVALNFTSGSSRFIRPYNDEPRDTRTNSTSVALQFSPGVTVFIMDYISFNVSFGVFGINMTHERQVTNGIEDGERTTSGANFKFNLFNISFGIGVHI